MCSALGLWDLEERSLSRRRKTWGLSFAFVLSANGGGSMVADELRVICKNYISINHEKCLPDFALTNKFYTSVDARKVSVEALQVDIRHNLS